MSTYGKRRRGGGNKTAGDAERFVQLVARMKPAQRARANHVAEHLDISVSYLVAQLVDALVVDETGGVHVEWQRRPAAEPAQTLPLTA